VDNVSGMVNILLTNLNIMEINEDNNNWNYKPLEHDCWILNKKELTLYGTFCAIMGLITGISATLLFVNLFN